jgi:galactokinase
MATRRVWAPGRVNLIGDHTDTTGGLVLPMAIDLGITLDVEPLAGRISLTSDAQAVPVEMDLPIDDPTSVEPAWGRYVAGVAALLRATDGIRGTVRSTLPQGSGLSSSAALEVAVALALGGPTDPRALAALCRDAEERASGVPCGIMDQLTSAGGVDGHALLIDCHGLDITPIAMPGDLAITVVHSGQERELAGSAYAARRAECERAEATIGPLRLASPADADRIDDPVVRRRARHVITENERVRTAAHALAAGDLATLGVAMVASHASLRDDFEVSTPLLDELVDEMCSTPGVIGARLTGAGFGGCVVVAHRPEARPAEGRRAWRVRPSAGASVLTS